MARPTALLGQLSRFGLAGALNTLTGVLVIAGLDLGAHVDSRIANAAGYGVGLVTSFVLSRSFVFESRRRARSTGPRFLFAAAIGFALNQAVLACLIGALGGSAGARVAAQAVAIVSYSAAMFVLCRIWVFRDPQSAVAAASGITATIQARRSSGPANAWRIKARAA